MNKVFMSSPVLVARKLVKLGNGCYMSMIDHSSAYKLIPVKFGHLWLQGFIWMGQIFIETSQIFGARSSVPNYDRFHYCFAEIVKVHGRNLVVFYERQLDDMIMMASTYSECKFITDIYIENAKKINLPLAPFNKPDKAFLNSQTGVVLGMYFDTRNMSYSLPNCKSDKFLHIISSALKAEKLSQKKMQQILGVINNVTQMSHSLKFFREPLVLDLKKTYHDPDESVVLSDISRRFLCMWLQILCDLRHGFPMSTAEPFPPASCLSFACDAAGGAAIVQGATFEVGVGAVGFVYPYEASVSDLFYAAQCFWPRPFITFLRDCNDRLFGNKTTCLETLGVFLPLFHNLKLILNKPVRVLVDNVAVYWAYTNGRSRKDPYTSLLVYILNMLASTFNFHLYIVHVKRVSTFPALVADTFTRSDPKGRLLFQDFPLPLANVWPPSLLEWMADPRLDWDLGERVVRDFWAAL